MVYFSFGFCVLEPGVSLKGVSIPYRNRGIGLLLSRLLFLYNRGFKKVERRKQKERTTTTNRLFTVIIFDIRYHLGGR